MRVTRETVLYAAELARLELTEEEIEKTASELADILAYFNKLDEVDTTGVKPMEHVIPVSNVFREDRALESYDRKRIMDNAPSEEKGCFKVPRIIE